MTAEHLSDWKILGSYIAVTTDIGIIVRDRRTMDDNPEKTKVLTLVAAAPDLLEALELAYGYLPNTVSESVHDKVFAALEKARGEGLMDNPEHCDKYSTGTHENWYQVFCGQCNGGAKLCVGCKKVVCAKCGKR